MIKNPPYCPAFVNDFRYFCMACKKNENLQFKKKYGLKNID